MSVPLGVGGRETPSRPIPWGNRRDEPIYQLCWFKYYSLPFPHLWTHSPFPSAKASPSKNCVAATRSKPPSGSADFRRFSRCSAIFAASTFSKYVTAVDHWIIFGLLVLIGGNMVREAFEEDEENAKETADFDWKHMLPLAVACSIDAFAVGVSFAFMTLNIWISVIIIGITTGLFSAAGLYIGRAFGSHWQKPAQIAGGVVLILIGVKVLLEYLGFLA